MLKIALTGNIASGKTCLQKYFEKVGFTCFCLDEAVDNIYQEEAFKKKLVDLFNTSCKKEISNIVFSDNKKLKALEEVIYPILKDKLDVFFENNKDKNAVIVAAAVLFESGFDKYFDKIIFVSADENIRLDRLMKRNNLSRKEAIKRIKSQDIEENKIKKSDFVIYNNFSLDEIIEKNKDTIIKINTLL